MHLHLAYGNLLADLAKMSKERIRQLARKGTQQMVSTLPWTFTLESPFNPTEATEALPAVLKQIYPSKRDQLLSEAFFPSLDICTCQGCFGCASEARSKQHLPSVPRRLAAEGYFFKVPFPWRWLVWLSQAQKRESVWVWEVYTRLLHSLNILCFLSFICSFRESRN